MTQKYCWLSMALGVALLVVACTLVVLIVLRGVAEAYAAGHVADILTMCKRIDATPTAELDDLQLAVVNYYPTGTIRRKGDTMDRAVESAREIALMLIRCEKAKRSK